MLLSDTIHVERPRDEVWAFLVDPERFASCIPGVGQVTPVDERTFDGTIAASVGTISGTFPFRASIVESTPPSEMKARIEGTDSITKSTMKTGVTLRLAESGSGTDLTYQANVQIGGRMAILGDMVVRAAAAAIAAEFARRLRSQLEAR
jgi:uncharacterized protein